MSQVSVRDALTDALRYWEPRRILYNFVLLAVVAAIYYSGPARIRLEVTFNTVQGFFVLAVLANVAYCAAYFVEVPAQMSGFGPLWLRLRWMLLLIGLAFGAVLANFFSRAIFGVAP
jgi:hypothetical protein